MSCATFRGWAFLPISTITCWASPLLSRAACSYSGIDLAIGLATGIYVSSTGTSNFNPALNNQVRQIGYRNFYSALQNSFICKGLIPSLFLQSTKQTAKSYVPGARPGQGLNNYTTDALRR